MEKYSSYKDSGVKWLGEIPSHWEMVRLKNCIIDSQSGIWGEDELHDGNDKICLRVADFNYDKGCIDEGNLTYRHYGNEFNSSKQLKQGDLLLEKSGGGDLFPVGRVVRFSIDDSKICTCSNFIQKLTIKSDVNSDFIYYLFKTMYYAKVNGLYFNQTTGIQNLKVKEYISQNIFIPTRTEQDAIVSYLDTVTSQIDVAIEQQKKMIELLNERKQIIINNAVTKGLDPNVKMKDSGVDWIGEIPEGWEVRKLKYLGKFQAGYAFPSNDFQEQGIKVVKISNIQPMNIDWKEVSYVDKTKYSNLKEFFIKKDDLLFALTRPIINGGIKVALYEEEQQALLNQRNALFNPNANINKKYLFYIMQNRSFIQEFESLIDNTGQQPNISTEDIKNIAISLPSISEQQLLSDYLDEQIAKIDTAITQQQQMIDYLNERKQIIINDVVTGKVKVS